ncbi:hypothetical protein, partial [Pseudomonas aeruginosa]|uniref:hypothetical protein n=1 Tax=Pseudomonas aeruginosa TaxID=287 RepID=UPI001C1FB636
DIICGRRRSAADKRIIFGFFFYFFSSARAAYDFMPSRVGADVGKGERGGMRGRWGRLRVAKPVAEWRRAKTDQRA